jgi:hypothetical protein
MDTNTVIAIIGAILGTLTGGASLIKLWRMEKHEAKKLDAESIQNEGSAAESYATAAALYAKEVASLKIELMGNQKRHMDEMEIFRSKQASEKAAMETRIIELGRKVEAMEIENKKLREWNIRLAYQIRSFGQIPVPFEVEEIITKKE